MSLPGASLLFLPPVRIPCTWHNVFRVLFLANARRNLCACHSASGKGSVNGYLLSIGSVGVWFVLGGLSARTKPLARQTQRVLDSASHPSTRRFHFHSLFSLSPYSGNFRKFC